MLGQTPAFVRFCGCELVVSSYFSVTTVLSFCCGTPIETEKFRSNGLLVDLPFLWGDFFLDFFGTWYHFIFIYYIHIYIYYKSQKNHMEIPTDLPLKCAPCWRRCRPCWAAFPVPWATSRLWRQIWRPCRSRMGWKDRVLLGCWWMMELVIWQCVKTLAPSEHQNFAGIYGCSSP